MEFLKGPPPDGLETAITNALVVVDKASDDQSVPTSSTIARSMTWLIENSHTCDLCSTIVLDSTIPPNDDEYIKVVWGNRVQARAAAAQVEHCPFIWKATDPERVLQNTWYTEERPFLKIGFTGPKWQPDWLRYPYVYTRTGGWKRWDMGAAPGDPAADYICTWPPLADVASQHAFEWIRTHFEECQASHQQACAPFALSAKPPSRLIDVGLENEAPRILHTNGNTFKYAALSYCWGEDQPYKTVHDNIAKYEKALKLPPGAKTIHDTIRVTRELHLRYLWIDVLCIVQDSTEDLTKELARMPDIYKGSCVTIAAASAKTSSAGFLEPRNPRVKDMVRLPYRCPNGDLGNTFLFNQDLIQVDEPINERAWTLQEEILSPRIINFGTETLQWKCYASGQSYGGTLGGGRKEPWPQSEFKKAMDQWCDIVVQYTRRLMTNEHDKLVAISAIAAELSRTIDKIYGSKKAEYEAGLWASDLPFQLLWYRSDEIPRPRPKQYRAPTWSWASVNGTVYFGDRKDSRLKLEVMQVHTDLKSRDLRYGQVTGGEVIVRGHLKSAIWIPGQMSLEDPTISELKGESLASVKLDATQEDLQLPDSTVWCLLGGFGPPPSFDSMHLSFVSRSIVGLILCKDISESGRVDQGDFETFRRVGYFEIDLDGHDPDKVSQEWLARNAAKRNWFGDCKKGTIRIL